VKERLTIKEGYKAMFNYLYVFRKLTKLDGLDGFLSSMQCAPDGSPMDPAAWKDWLEAVEKVKKGICPITVVWQ